MERKGPFVRTGNKIVTTKNKRAAGKSTKPMKEERKVMPKPALADVDVVMKKESSISLNHLTPTNVLE